MNHRTSPAKAYDFLLKFLLVGDSDVGKGEILASLEDGASESPYGYNMGECPVYNSVNTKIFKHFIISNILFIEKV